MNPYIINLEEFRTPGAKVFTGRDRGKEVRDKSRINSLISKHDLIIIRIPDDIRSINPSFLEEFLLGAVGKLGEEKFNEKVKFENKGRYKIDEDLEEAIERILRNENALA